ncbi:MAG TPA: histidine kinase [Arachnia sp.]|nr:histidine kinase [Arachnia sp.]HMT87591.1 histidine kinase [Arachnia sp.]
MPADLEGSKGSGAVVQSRRPGFGWWLASRVLLSGFAVVAVASQRRLWGLGEVSRLEWMPFSVAVVGFIFLVWTRWRTAGAAVVILGYAGVAMLPGAFNSGLWFVIFPFLVETNARKPLWLGLSVSAVLTVGSVVDWGEGVGVSLMLVIYIWSLSLLGMFIRAQRENQLQLRELNELQRKAERQALGADMHDGVVAALTQATLLARATLLRRVSGEEDRETLMLIETNLSSALEELRSIVRVLGDGGAKSPADAGPLGQSLAEAKETLEKAGFAATLTTTGSWLSADQVDEIARLVLREAVANAMRHGAPGGVVVIAADKSDGLLTLAVTNQLPADGDRRASGGGLGLGLHSLAGRVERAGGSFETYADDGAWVLRAELPMDQGEKNG